jgi:hypothetical protein
VIKINLIEISLFGTHWIRFSSNLLDLVEILRIGLHFFSDLHGLKLIELKSWFFTDWNGFG